MRFLKRVMAETKKREDNITKTNYLIIKLKSILILAMFLLLCVFSAYTEARSEIPNNLIDIKETQINKIILGAGEGITLTRTYKVGTESINLEWTQVAGATKYNIYQQKQGEEAKLISTQTGTSVTLNKNNSGIKDEAAPDAPEVTATQTADGTGNDIIIKESKDNGTTYRHRITVTHNIGYTQKSYTTPGTYIWTCPEYITILRVALCGGGAGATMGTNFTTVEQAGSGGTSRFDNLIEATGAVGLKITTVYNGSRVKEWRQEGYTPGTPNGNKGGSTYNSNYAIGGKGFALSFENLSGTYGQGGRTRGYYNYEGPQDFSWAGHSGGYNTGYVNVVPGNSYEIIVGEGGEPCELGKSSGYAEKGTGGFVLIAYGGNIQPETVYESNTVSTTVTTGIKGYQYAITTKQTHTFTDEEIVSLADIPTFISGEEEMVQYLHIRAVDNNGNVSETKSILLQVPAKITLKSEYMYGMNEVPLSWTINDKRAGYVYRLYQKEEGQEEFTQIASSNSVETIKEEGTKAVAYTTPGTYTWIVPEGVTKIRVAVAGAGGGGAVASGEVIVSAKTGGTSLINYNGKEYFKATGGTGGYIRSVNGSHHSNVHGNSNPYPGQGGSPNGRNGGARYDLNETSAGILAPGAGWKLGFTGETGEYGEGGYARHRWNVHSVWICSATGGSGGYDTGYISVTPGESLTITVGAGGEGAIDIAPSAASACSATPGKDGYVYIEYDYITKEHVIYENNTVDTSATDKFAPAILELYLNGIKGDKTKYEIGMLSEDYGTTYEHYVTGENKQYNMMITSNIEITEVITGIAGYSWKIDSDETGEADTTIGFDNDKNTTTTFPSTISTDYLDKGYYLHARAVDNAGNWGATVHVKLETTTITLTSHYDEYTDSNGYGPNYVPLTWTNSNQIDKFFYKLFQKNEDKSEWQQVSTNYGKNVRVLNVYPNAGSQLKGWMQKYGLGLITVDEVRITDFNSNPNKYLINNGEYQYDVIMFGSWDNNNGYDLSWSAAVATEEFIKTGRGVLFGHDTICDYGGMGHSNFNYLAKYIKATPTRNVARVGSSTVKVIKKGFLTKYPYDIETRNLTVPYCHTSGVLVYSDIWIKFLNLGGPLTDGPDIGFNNYYLASWNNCAFIRTGHSNGAATEDEQKILANVLFYLGQVTDDTYANVYTAEDLAAPEISDVKITDNKKENRLEFDIKGIDYGTSYDHYVTAMKLLTAGNYYSNTVHTIVKTGINKFQYTINNSKTEYSGTEYEVSAINKESCELNIDKSYIGQYLHIRAVDNAGNVGAVTTIYLDGARTISREERNETEELYCVEEDVLIPAEYDGTQSDATVEIAGQKETLNWPLNLQKLFEVYKEDGVALRNPYTQNGQSGFADKSNTLGRYLVERVPGTISGKEGNASETYAYILSHYSDNNVENSESQNALYEIIAEENGNITDGSRRNILYYEAKEYAKFREILKSKGGFIPGEVTHNVQVGYNVENKQFIVGPFEVDYVRNYSIINDGKGNSKKVEFSGIGVGSGTVITEEKAIRIYDQDGKLINPNSWELEYDNKAEKEKTRGETYAEYPMPLPGEEFYIKLNRVGNENVTEISKIEIEYYEMEADAKYRILNGNYSTVTWNADQNANICEGGTLCPHGRTNKHTVGHTYYVSSEITSANLHSQRLLEVEWAKREYKKHVQTLTITANKGANTDEGSTDPGNPGGGTDPDNPSGEIEPTIRLTMDFSGNIWNDKNENISNGIREIEESGIKGVEVFLYDINTGKLSDYTVTDEKGNYIFEKVPVGIYYIEYTYDGQTYRTTKSFVQGDVEDYKTNGNGKIYANVSIVDETEDERQALNNRFYEIKEGEAIGTNGEKTSLTYKETERTSQIITREEETQKAYNEFQIRVNTANKDIYFPATNTIIVNGIPYLIIDDNKNINVGLSEREKTDENLRIDVYQTIFSIKGVRQTYLHSGKDIRDINSNKVVKEYIQKVNPDDYNWRLSDYEGNEKYEEIKEIYESGEACELETYVEYMIVLRNSGANDTAYITELADYYDKTLEYKDNYRDFDISSWIVIRNDDDTESTYSGANSKEQIKWSESSRYGDTNDYSEEFNKMYANLEKYGIKKGQYAEIHIIFRVLKDEDGNIMLDSGEGKKNAAEINGYRNLNTQNGKIAGLIDLDSKPGDLNPTQEANVYEDDEDKAPYYKLQLGYSNGDNDGNNGNGGDGDGDGNNGNGGNVETDEDGNVIGYGNTIEGNVWEDIKNISIEEDGRKISNGVKEDNEPLIDDIKVELVEIISGYSNKTGEYKEIEVTLDNKTVRTGNELLLTDKEQSKGAYRFSHLSGGKYKVRFIYGEKEQLEKNLKYNGQDYQALSSAQIYDKDSIENSYENSEIMIAIDNSNSMSGNKITKAKTAAIELIEALREKLPGIKIGVTNFNEQANMIGAVGADPEQISTGINNLYAGGETAIARGIEKAKQGYGEAKTKLMVIITDGQETVETEEDVIRKIETLREEEISLISVLTGVSQNIFGTEDNPRYGEVYSIINEDDIYDKIVGEIYEKIKSQSEIEENRSLGKDLEGNKENPEEGTRRWQINEYQEMTYKKGTILDIEGIDKLTGNERTERIENLSNTTYMKAETKKVTFAASNIGADKIHEVNQALVERPRTRLELTEEVTAIKVMLSDGEVIIDTAKGLSKNVMGLEIPDAPVSVYMDEEIMQGATIEVTYKLVVTNTGEVDRLSNYFEGESDDTITTTSKVIYAYVNQNIVYREDSQTGDASWEITEIKDRNENGEGILEGELSEETIEGIKNGTTITLRTEGLKEIELYPIGSKELKLGEGTYKSEISTDLVLSKLISPEDDETTSLTYDCAMEITVRGNEVGRRMIGAIPGNHRLEEEGTVISLEPDEAVSRRIVITKPLGENLNKDYILYIVGALSVIAISTICSRSIIKAKNNKKK